MRKFIIGLFLFVITVVIVAVAGLYYIKPSQELDLAYRKVPIADRAIDMVKRMSLDMIVTESDVNSLLKAELAKDPYVQQDVEVMGASFKLIGDLLIADLNVIWKDLVPSSLRIVYRLSWDNPNVVAAVEEARIKSIPLPKSAMSGFVIPLGDELPKPLKIDSIDWGIGELTVKLKKPSLSDLAELL